MTFVQPHQSCERLRQMHRLIILTFIFISLLKSSLLQPCTQEGYIFQPDLLFYRIELFILFLTLYIFIYTFLEE